MCPLVRDGMLSTSSTQRTPVTCVIDARGPAIEPLHFGTMCAAGSPASAILAAHSSRSRIALADRARRSSRDNSLRPPPSLS
jgi:hypothetical protein